MNGADIGVVVGYKRECDLVLGGGAGAGSVVDVAVDGNLEVKPGLAWDTRSYRRSGVGEKALSLVVEAAVLGWLRKCRNCGGWVICIDKQGLREADRAAESGEGCGNVAESKH